MTLFPLRSAWALAALLAFAVSGPTLSEESIALPSLPVVNRALSLQDALALASIHSITLEQANADVRISVAEAQSAQAPTKLSLSATTYGTVGDASNILTSSPGVMPQNVFAVPPHGFADQDLMLMAPLFTGGRLRAGVVSARKRSEAVELTVQASQLAVAETVTEDYTNAVMQQALVDVAGARLTAEDEQVRITGTKVTAGRLAPVDLRREQAEQADARQTLLAAQNTAALALVSLKTTLGVSQDSQITLSDTLDGLVSNAALPASLPDALQGADANRPELAASRKAVEAVQAALHGTRGEYAPQVYAVVMGDAMTGQAVGRTGYTVGVTASLPLLDGGQRRADADVAQARLDRALADAQEARQRVDQDVTVAWLNLGTAQAQVGAAQMGVAAAQESYDLADLRYNAGKSVTAERLDALSALARAQGSLAVAKAAVVTARAKLIAAVGTSPSQ